MRATRQDHLPSGVGQSNTHHQVRTNSKRNRGGSFRWPTEKRNEIDASDSISLRKSNEPTDLGVVSEEVLSGSLGSSDLLDGSIRIVNESSGGEEDLDVLRSLLDVSFDVHGESGSLGDGELEKKEGRCQTKLVEGASLQQALEKVEPKALLKSVASKATAAEKQENELVVINSLGNRERSLQVRSQDL